MFCRNDQHIVRSATHCHGRSVEWFGVHQAVDGVEAKLAKLRRAYVARGERRLCQVLAGAGDVVVVGEHVGGCSGGSSHRESSRVAGCAADRIRDDYAELRSVIGSRCWSSRVTGGGCPRDRRSSLLPLIGERSGAGRRHREGSGLAHGDGLVSWLGNNRGRGRADRCRRTRRSSAS